MSKHWKILLPAILVAGLQAACTGGAGPDLEASAPATDAVTEADHGQQQWYVGGTLHEAGALEWQRASAEDKLATVADLLARAWEGGFLTREVHSQIHGIDDFRPFAETLVHEMDIAFEPAEDPEENRRMFVNQKVASSAAMLMVFEGWLE